ncbi:hypothetical protein ACFQ2M_14345 [Kitasatospora saccharophila]
MAELNFGGYSLYLKEQRHAISMLTGFGAHRLTIQLECAATGTFPPEVAHSVAGELWADGLGQSGWLGHLLLDWPVKATSPNITMNLATTLTDTQLAGLEKARQGNDLQLRLHLTVTALNGDGSWPARTTQVAFTVPHNEWSQVVTEAGHGAFVTVLVPITADENRATAARRLREAQNAVRAGDFEAAVSKARLAMDAVRPTDHQKAYSAASAKKAKDRDQDERWTVLLQAAYDLFGGAHHDDPDTTEHFTWNRADAVTALALTAGLLGRLDDK